MRFRKFDVSRVEDLKIAIQTTKELLSQDRFLEDPLLKILLSKYEAELAFLQIMPTYEPTNDFDEYNKTVSNIQKEKNNDQQQVRTNGSEVRRKPEVYRVSRKPNSTSN